MTIIQDCEAALFSSFYDEQRGNPDEFVEFYCITMTEKQRLKTMGRTPEKDG